jgi:LPXTG-motif cell wall-anchored protein
MPFWEHTREVKKMKPWYLLLCILILTLVMCTPSSAEVNATPKAVVLDLSMNGDLVHVIGSHVVYNYPPDNRATKKIVIRMMDAKGVLLAEQGIEDPRIVYLEEGVAIRDQVNFSVIVPFRSDMATINLYNGTSNALMLSADVSGGVNTFCKEHGNDPDCAVSGSSPVLVAVIVVIVVLLAGAGWYLMRKKKA